MWLLNEITWCSKVFSPPFASLNKAVFRELARLAESVVT